MQLRDWSNICSGLGFHLDDTYDAIGAGFDVRYASEWPLPSFCGLVLHQHEIADLHVRSMILPLTPLGK